MFQAPVGLAFVAGAKANPTGALRHRYAVLRR
jgi:hypothetical protein